MTTPKDALDLDTWTEVRGDGRRWAAGPHREFRLIFWPDAAVLQFIDYGPPMNPVATRADNSLFLHVTDPDGRLTCRELAAGFLSGPDLALWLTSFHPICRRGGWVARVVSEFLGNLS